ncbi:MAG: hypothetical protein FD126_627, partial [Elusimicrobia bacterium]
GGDDVPVLLDLPRRRTRDHLPLLPRPHGLAVGPPRDPEPGAGGALPAPPRRHRRFGKDGRLSHPRSGAVLGQRPGPVLRDPRHPLVGLGDAQPRLLQEPHPHLRVPGPGRRHAPQGLPARPPALLPPLLRPPDLPSRLPSRQDPRPPGRPRRRHLLLFPVLGGELRPARPGLLLLHRPGRQPPGGLLHPAGPVHLPPDQQAPPHQGLQPQHPRQPRGPARLLRPVVSLSALVVLVRRRLRGLPGPRRGPPPAAPAPP